MPLCYEPLTSDPLRQGEIIGGLYEYRPVMQADGVGNGGAVQFEKVTHPFSIILSQDCDLLWDYEARNEKAADDKVLFHILICPLYSKEEIRNSRDLKSDQFRRIQHNNEERYHRFADGPIRGTENVLPELYGDFKSVFSLPTNFVYYLINTGQVLRNGYLQSPYLEQFTHRLYAFMGRVPIRED